LVKNQSAAIGTFVSEIDSYITAHAEPGSKLAGTAAMVFEGLKRLLPPVEQPEPQWLPVCPYLDDALGTLRSRADLIGIGQSFADFARNLRWYRRADAEKVGPAFAEGHANAIVAGPGGLKRAKPYRSA
jgi:Dimethlysulfonioproprionate lyase